MTTPKRRQIKTDLSNEAKVAALKSMITNPNNRLQKDNLNKLLDLYGPYAYDIVQKAMARPADLMQDAGQGFMTTRQAINYFANNEISAETIAKIAKKDPQTVEEAIGAYKMSVQANEDEPTARVIEERQRKMSDHIDARASTDQASTLTPTDKQLKEMKSWAKTLRMNVDETTTKLVEKYGALAYDVMRDCVNKPSVVMKNMNEKALGSSKKTLEYFLENDIPTEKLAKALKLKEEDVIQKMPAGRETAFDERVDSKAQEQQETVQQQEGMQQIIDRDPENMTLNDWVRNYPADKKPLSKSQLIDAAYDDFGKGEGAIRNIYQDHLGNPTVGVGHLVFLKEKVNDANHIAQYRKKFQALDLQKNGRRLTSEEKGRLYDTMVNNVRRTGSIGNASQYGTLTDAGMKNIFKEDLSWAYGVAKKQFPQIDKYPSDLQLTLVHAYFGGYANIIDETIKGKFSRAHRKYNVPAMAEFKNLNKDDPVAVQKMLKTMISDINGRNTANAFEKQIINVSDTLSVAQSNYALTHMHVPGIQISSTQDAELTPLRMASLQVKER